MYVQLHIQTTLLAPCSHVLNLLVVSSLAPSAPPPQRPVWPPALGLAPAAPAAPAGPETPLVLRGSPMTTLPRREMLDLMAHISQIYTYT